MRRFLLLIVLVTWTLIASADEPVQINFNLVQVNNYPGQASLTDSIATPGKRLVIDLTQSSAALRYLTATSSIPIRFRDDLSYRTIGGGGVGAALAWESSVVMYAPAKGDSFLVSASRRGCPGTEVAPSVAVAFSNGAYWSDPPIRFGPLTERTVCPLGKGFQLEVRGRGINPPLVRITADRSLYGKR